MPNKVVGGSPEKAEPSSLVEESKSQSNVQLLKANEDQAFGNNNNTGKNMSHDVDDTEAQGDDNNKFQEYQRKALGQKVSVSAVMKGGKDLFTYDTATLDMHEAC